MAARFRPNQPRFVDETIDGESLIMDMVRGSYFSCVGASASAWLALTAGASVDEVAGRIEALGVDRSQADADLAAFVEALLADELLVPLAGGEAPPAGAGALDAIEWPEAYEPLAIERFTDLADLILLDPVHDVSEAGWPHSAAE